jgi:hypothetical protein
MDLLKHAPQFYPANSILHLSGKNFLPLELRAYLASWRGDADLLSAAERHDVVPTS